MWAKQVAIQGLFVNIWETVLNNVRILALLFYWATNIGQAKNSQSITKKIT